MSRDSGTGTNSDSYANPKYSSGSSSSNKRGALDMHQRTNRVVQGALCFSPIATKATTPAADRARTMEEEARAGRSPAKWASIPSTSDISASSSSHSHYSTLTHPFARNHPHTNKEFTRAIGRSVSEGGGQGLQLITTPMLLSTPRGYSFLLSLVPGYPTNPHRRQKQVEGTPTLHV